MSKQTPPPPAATIEVTIGRIEIHARAPARPARPAPAAAPPLMSLAQYMRRGAKDPQ